MIIYKEEKYNHLRQHLAIDELRLDEELLRQPVMMQEAAEGAAGAIRDRDGCNHILKLAEADEANNMRRYVDENDKPFSEARVNRELPLCKRVKEAKEDLDDAEYSVRIWQALAGAYSDKGSGLRRIADLTIAGYLTPSSTYESRREEQAKARGDWRAEREERKQEPEFKQRGKRANA